MDIELHNIVIESVCKFLKIYKRIHILAADCTTQINPYIVFLITRCDLLQASELNFSVIISQLNKKKTQLCYVSIGFRFVCIILKLYHIFISLIYSGLARKMGKISK